RLPVVVSEHRDHRDLDGGARVRDGRHLVDLPVLGQVARQQHEVRLLLDALERLTHAVALRRAGMDVAGGGDPHRLSHALPAPEDWTSDAPETTPPCPATAGSASS